MGGRGGEITPSDLATTELSSPFYKVAGLSIISSELAEDSSPEAAQLVGAGLARDIAKKIDAAYFGKSTTPEQPKGIEDVVGVTAVQAGTAWVSLDPFTEAAYNAEGVGATLSAFVANPADALTLAKLKQQTGSNVPLLGADPTKPTRRTLGGIPLLVSAAVEAGTVWGIPSGQTMLAIRRDVRLERDASVYFTSDRVAIKATLRVTFVFPHAAAIQKVTISA